MKVYYLIFKRSMLVGQLLVFDEGENYI